LESFKDSGLVRQIDFQHGIAYYELASLGRHHHAVCTDCKLVEDVAGVCSETLNKQALKKSGFAAIKTHSLEFFGLCKSCARKAKTA
jgi:Fur family ferric uptake transcriptional regulator